MANISIMDALTRVSKTIKDYIDRNNLTDDQMNTILTEVFGSSNVSVVSTKFSEILSSTSTWQVFGDSISTTYNISENQIWHNLITADSTYSGITKYNNSLTGSEVSDGGRDIDSFVERYTSLNSNATLVTIFAGVNDWAHNNIPLGNYDDITTNQSFYGALNTLLPGVKAQCPNARVIWLSPLKTKSGMAVEHTNADGTNTLGLYLTDYIQAIKYKCNQYDVEFINLYGVTGLDPDIDTGNFQSDGLHLNATGHVALMNYLLNTAEAGVPADKYGSTEEPDPTPSGDYVTEGLSLYLDSANSNNTTSTLADMSGNGNDFTSAVTIATNEAGRVVLGGSQYFTNSSYVPYTTTDDDFTFEFFGDITATGGRNYLFSFGSRNGFSWDEQYGISGQMGTGDFIFPGTDTVNGNTNRIAPTFGEKHIILTKNGTTFSLYENGQFVASVEYTTSWSDTSYTNPFRLFIRYNDSNILQGTMKYVRWYTKGFTANEVTQNYNSRNSTASSGGSEDTGISFPATATFNSLRASTAYFCVVVDVSSLSDTDTVVASWTGSEQSVWGGSFDEYADPWYSTTSELQNATSTSDSFIASSGGLTQLTGDLLSGTSTTIISSPGSEYKYLRIQIPIASAKTGGSWTITNMTVMVNETTELPILNMGGFFTDSNIVMTYGGAN